MRLAVPADGQLTIHHLDLVVTSLERSLAFYRDLLRPLGYVDEGSIVGERGERVVYLEHGDGHGAVGLRERRSDAHGVPYDRYAVFFLDPDGIKLEVVHTPAH